MSFERRELVSYPSHTIPTDRWMSILFGTYIHVTVCGDHLRTKKLCFWRNSAFLTSSPASRLTNREISH